MASNKRQSGTDAGKKASGRRVAGKKSPGTKQPKAGKKPVRKAVKAAGKKRVAGDPMEAVKKTMQASMPEIVEAMVEQAKNGSCPHAKTLLEMTGAKHLFEGSEAEPGGEPWAKKVLEKLAEEESGGEAGEALPG